MSHLNNEIEQLKSDILNMWGLVRNQLDKTNKALVEFDQSLAMEVLAHDKRVDAFELKINMKCENILALFHPLANDLRFVLAVLKIAYNLERVGDYAKNIAKLISNSEEAFDSKSLNEAQVEKMFIIANGMLTDAMNAFIHENGKAINQVFTNDNFLDDINKKSNEIIGSIIHRNPSKIESALNLLSIIRKLERVGDQTKNISEEIIFYIEAKVLRHKNEMVNN